MSALIRYRAPQNKWKYVRFTLVLTRGQYSGIFQISEFTLKYQGSAVSYAGVSITPVVGGGEGTASLIDGNLGSKAFNIGATFTIYNPVSFLFDSYTWGTANDVPDRDPVRWIIDASQDNVAWTVLDDKSGADQTITTNRNTYVQDFPISTAKVGVAAMITYRPAPNVNAVFTYTGADQTYVVPAGITTMTVTLWGAGGGSSISPAGGGTQTGGAGACLTGTMLVTPGETLTIIVGGPGTNTSVSAARPYGGGGIQGRSGQVYSSSGGGRSAIRRSTADVVTVGAGGGGRNGIGGAGGITTGGTGQNSSATGGTQTEGGIRTGSGLNGTLNLGGDAGQDNSAAGGSGYYGGGGGGQDNNGGGGSSLYSNLLTYTGYTSATGIAPNNTSPLYVTGVGNGGTYAGGGTGGPGLVVLSVSNLAAPQLQITFANFPVTSGGVITTSGPYRVHTFKTVGTSTFTTNKQVTAQVLVVGGGGGGGNNVGGGGGAGAALYSSLFSIPAGSYTITIGGGGAADTNGSSSIFSSFTAVGGGSGGSWRGGSGVSGGCGGGGGPDSGIGGAGTVGFAGGNPQGFGAGGGGGMGSAGLNAITGQNVGGAGGLGATYSVGGASYLVCGGGAGSSYRTASIVAAGGSGIGGTGANSELGPGPTNPTPNTGSGGGGGGGGTSGAAGIIVIALIPYLS